MAKTKHSSTPAESGEVPVANAPESTLTKARVLATGVFGVINTVVELDENMLRQGVACGQLDPHPDAVEYAASLNKE